MTGHWATVLVFVRVLLLIVGVATTAISFRAYRRRRHRYLRDATIGFGLVTFGVFIEGVLYQLTSLTLTQVHIVESIAIGAGFLVLLSSFIR